MRQHGPEIIGSVLSDLLARLTEKKGAGKDEIPRLWHGAVGSRAAQHSRPAFLRAGRLYVDVDSPAWFYKLNLSYKKRALGRLRKTLGERVKTICFRIGEL